MIFKVTQNDGLVAADGGTRRRRSIATTDAQGRAQVQWTLGGRAGAGGNRVEAYSVGFDGTAIFTATGSQGTAGKIVVDTGNDQIGAIGQPLPKPFIAVVVDEGNNRLGGVPVTFSVIGGRRRLRRSAEPDRHDHDSDGRVAATLTLGDAGRQHQQSRVGEVPVEHRLPGRVHGIGPRARRPAKTTISGVVLDNSNVPIPGVTVRAVLTKVLHVERHRGECSCRGGRPTRRGSSRPAGAGRLREADRRWIDGARCPGSYPTLDYDMVTVAGQTTPSASRFTCCR